MERKPVYAGLDLIRFFAAMLVVFYHLGTATWAAPDILQAKIVNGRVSFPETFPFFGSGFIGVEIFFVLSGIVISYSASKATYRSFLIGRACRLYPGALICGAVTAAALYLFRVDGRPPVLLSLLHSITLYPFPPWIDGVYWTLGIELVFYGCIFLLLWRADFEKIAIFAIIIGLTSSAYWLGGNWFWPQFLERHLWDRYLELSLLSYGIYFSLGISLYLFSHNRSWFFLFFACLMVAAACVEITFKTAHNDSIFHTANSPLQPVAIFILSVIAMACSLQWTSSSRITRAIGLTTYPLYLTHDYAGTLVLAALAITLPRYVALAATVAICVMISFMIAVYLERPLQTFLRNIFATVRQ